MFFEDDICLCGNGDKCPNGDTCYRYRHSPVGICTVSLFYNPDAKKCDFYIPTSRENKERSIDHASS